jgi:hypothetical protein
MSLGQYNASQDLNLSQVWYGGTSTLKAGHAVAYDLDDTNAPLTTTSNVPLDRRNIRGKRVVDPATANLGMFAGIVDDSSDGAVGPCFITIIRPRKGDVMSVWSNVNCTKASTQLGITNAGALILVSVADSTFNVDWVCTAMQTVDRSSTNGLVLSRFA